MDIVQGGKREKILEHDIPTLASKEINPFESIAKAGISLGHVKDDRIHCGNEIYIQIVDYNNAKNKVTGDDYSRFIKHVAVSIIGNEELKRSSVTGRGCNRTKTNPKPALNQKKLGAVYGIFRHFLANEKKKDPVEIEQELYKVGSYVAQKIADLNRAPSKKKKKMKDDDVKETKEADDGRQVDRSYKSSDESSSDEDEGKTESEEKKDSSSTSDEMSDSDD